MAQAVVLPEPCRPAIRITVGPLEDEGQLAAGAAHQPGQLLVDDLHHLLAGIEALQHLGTQAALLQRPGEGFDDLEVDVGLEQREADLAHRRIDVGLAQLAPRADVGERRLEAV